MAIEVRQIREEDIDGFHAAVDVREHKYLALLEAPPMERATVVGWCNIPPATREVMAHVGDLFMGLLPQWRGQGLGERLLRESLVAADAFGYLRVELGVFASNTRATALYRKAGFVEEGTKRRAILINGVFHDEIIMARPRD
jgi:RimJ/RimL family protein N-acetyltransferase